MLIHKNKIGWFALLTLIGLLLWNSFTFGKQSFHYQNNRLFQVKDTILKKKDNIGVTKRDTIGITSIDTLQVTDSLTQKDSISIDSLQKKKSILTDIVKYKAKDSIIINQKKEQIFLYNNTQVTYEDIDLKAGIDIINYKKNEVYAGRIKDSVGELSQSPVFKQGTQIAEPDSIRFNYKTQRAIILNSYTQQDENHIKASIVKKENDSTYFLKNGIITTAEDIDNPDYYILVRKAKFVPKKKIVAGFSNMYIADVPTPIALPFAYYPMVDKRTSGVIFPTYGEINDRGYFLQNGGYYFVINDYFDLALTGDYYTNGSYGARAQSSYRKRYKYSGNLNIRYENMIYSQRGFPDYSRNSIYNIQWSHSQDSKASPNSNFSASVNLGSSTYYKNSFNQTNSSNFLNNTLSSSISYSRTFPSYPSVNLSITASHSQNTKTQSINMTLPALRASMERIYPFSKRGTPKKGIIQNINFQYSMQADNRFNTTDSLFFSKKMFEEAHSGIKHSIPISTNFKLAKYISMGINSSINETWQFKTIRKRDFDINLGKSVKDTVNGFDRFMSYNIGASMGTTIYGTFDFGKKHKIQAIRHVMRPSVSYGYTPSFDQYYDYYIADAFGKEQQYTRFEGGMYGTPSLSESNSISFSLSNTFEAKVRKKENDSLSTDKENTKKVTLLNSLNFNSNYNFITKKFSPINMTGGTQLFNNKLGVNFGATLNPYAIDNDGNQLETFNINNGGSLFRMTNANLTMNYAFSSKDFNTHKGTDSSASGGRKDDLFGSSNDFGDEMINSDKTEIPKKKKETQNDGKNVYYKNKMPWDLRIAYSLSYSNARRESKISNNSLMFSGNIDLSSKWRVGVSSGYDFMNKGFTYTQLRFERDLNSFRMSFNVTPFGNRSSWYFFIGIKSSMLSDLKYEKNKVPDRVLR